MKLFAAVVCLLCLLPGCRPSPEPAAKPQQAGMPLSPVETAAHMARVQTAAMVGDEEGVRQGMTDLNDGLRRSMKLADPARRVDREAARQLARQVDGVRSVAWIDHENLLAIVSSNAARSYDTVDAICLQLESLGDTLGVVVNLQSGAATTGDELEILSRNCQLQPGDRALFQRHRQVDVVPSEVRARHRQNNARPVEDPARLKREQDAAIRVLEATTPEM